MPLLVYGLLGQGFRLESFVRDRYPAFDRSAVSAMCDALLGAPDGGELLEQVGREGHADRLGFASAARVVAISGLLTPNGPFDGDFGTKLG
jgi:hypothetical protein